MSSRDTDTMISNFLRRKETEFPELVIAGRHESRTQKYATELRVSGQLLLTH